METATTLKAAGLVIAGMFTGYGVSPGTPDSNKEIATISTNIQQNTQQIHRLNMAMSKLTGNFEAYHVQQQALLNQSRQRPWGADDGSTRYTYGQ